MNAPHRKFFGVLPPRDDKTLHRECCDYFVKAGRSDLAAEAETKSALVALMMRGEHAGEALGQSLEDLLAAAQALNEASRR